MVEIRHADGNTTLYAHLSEINVQQGEKVVRGQRIGRVGSTGNATGPHLHFEVITSEGKADPADYLWTMPGEWIMGYAADTEAGISPTAVGNTGKSVIHYYSLAKDTTTTVTGSLGHLPTKAIKSGSTEYPAYCLEKEKLIWGNIDFTWSSFTVPQQTTMKAILAEGFHETNSLDKAKWGDAQGSGLKGNYANETAKWLVTQYLIWAAEKNYITKHSNTSWTWKSQVDTDLETVAKKAMRRIVAYGFNNTNSLQDGNAGWYSAATAKMMVTQHLVWLASEGYITVDGTNWSWGTGIDNDVERMANLAYNGSVVRSYYAELKDRLLRSEIVPSFAGKNSDGSDAQEIDLQLVNGKYTATVTDTNGVLDLFDFQKAGFDISRNGNTLTISTSTLPEQETTIIGAGYTVGDKNSIAVWEDKDQQANIQHQATCPGTTKTMAYIKIKGEKPSYTITLNKTSADLTVTNDNPNYSLNGAVYYVYKDVNISDYPYWDHEPYATFITDANGHAELSKKLQPGNYVTFVTPSTPTALPLGWQL